MKKRVYLAGPMSNKPGLNFPAFRRAAERLRGAGYEVVSPVELDEADGINPDSVTANDVEPGSWGWCRLLARDLAVVADPATDALVTLPGHTKSRGAFMETSLAIHLDKPVIPLKKALDV